VLVLVTFFYVFKPDITVFVVIHEFCRISVEFLRKGINAKVYQTASRKYLYIISMRTIT